MAEHGARVAVMNTAFLENLREKKSLVYLGIYGRIILKCILRHLRV